MYRTALRAEGADPRTRTPAAARCPDTGTTRRATRRALLALAPVALVATALFGWCTRAEHLAPPLDDRATSAAADLGAAASPAFAAVLPAAGPTPRIPARADTLADEPLRRTVLAVPVAAAPKVVRVTGRVADSGGFSMAGVRVRAVALERQAPDESARVDDYGHFEFTGLRHGPWALSVDTQGLRRDLLLAEPAPRRDVVVGDADQDAGLFVIERAASLGDRLVVGVSADALNLRKKGREPVFSESERLEIVAALRMVDEVFVEESLELKREYIERYDADVLVMGDDWRGRFDEFGDVCEVVYLPRTPAISTTALIEKISSTG